ncbi:MAG: D-isomer specific 2-hydroxyacid dehydrogenase family protein, partial [Streptosporangiaceae bacterium]
MTKPRIAIGPVPRESTVRAVRAAGGEVVPADENASALVWLDPVSMPGLRAALAATPAARWVQLPFAGVERVAAAGLLDPARVWTCAKGAYAEPVAEHALMLAMAGLRFLPERIAARTWGKAAGASLYDQPVTILGGGGIAASLLSLLAAMRAKVTVVRRQPGDLPGASRTLQTSQLAQALPEALVVFLALALTPATTHLIGAPELAAMRRDAWLVNVARGPIVDTDALVAALRGQVIGGAALDVTDPEPLPDGHPLWGLDNCIITPHTADTDEMVEHMLNLRVQHNVAAFAAG